MNKLKVTIKDKNTLELNEDGRKGDIIDLSALNGADISAVSAEIKAVAREEAKRELAAELEIRKAANAAEWENRLLKQQEELGKQYRDKLTAIEIDKHKSDLAIERQKEEIERLKNEKETAIENEKHKLQSAHKSEIERLDKEITLLKDMRFKQSTKMLGETLEKHCDVSFEHIRGFLPPSVAYGKDTDAKEGSMGDRIYRELDDGKNEVLSIMFEMKNEDDRTATKQKNEHFFRELDKDRNQKNCEYAVLVSLLEKDNDIYDGFYAVPGYKDMFVIRPQDFTKIIMWLRNVKSKFAAERKELAAERDRYRDRDLDIAEFENRCAEVRDKFGKHYQSAVDKHKSAVEEIDKIIRDLTKMRDYLTGSDRQLQLALNGLDALTVENLAKKSPSIKAEIKKLRDAS